jgi:hypothetical protein
VEVLPSGKGNRAFGSDHGKVFVGKWKSCHQEREIEPLGVTMAKPLWSHAEGIGRTKIYTKI